MRQPWKGVCRRQTAGLSRLSLAERPETYVTSRTGHMGDTCRFLQAGGAGSLEEGSVMEKRLFFVGLLNCEPITDIGHEFGVPSDTAYRSEHR